MFLPVESSPWPGPTVSSMTVPQRGPEGSQRRSRKGRSEAERSNPGLHEQVLQESEPLEASNDETIASPWTGQADLNGPTAQARAGLGETCVSDDATATEVHLRGTPLSTCQIGKDVPAELLTTPE